ncbi:hypothetical protein N7520_011441 [Penicillium odoratum]|uniref:uncharacterized protein n=1 Tax=Penicillium odoratum TaxID=1167516 RepID=UPI002546B76F|nr:uncharacterized protein N7520_011441 [Penicillium odoratum]KAJ5746259.1 hypothetical protein N7520_011441 [Penicillium odoratum]
MAGPFHTYGPNCLLADEEPEFTSLYSLSAPPELRSQFFYVSSLPIDDPLAPLPAASGQASGNERAPPQPFSARDNLALEAAWSDLREAQRRRSGSSGTRLETSKGRAGIAVPGHEAAFERTRRRKTITQGESSLASSRGTPSNPTSVPDETPGSSSINASHRKRVFSSSVNEPTSAKRRSLSPPEDDLERQEIAGSLQAPSSRDASMSGSPFIRAPESHPDTPLGRSFESDGAGWQAELRSNAPHHSSKPSGLRATVRLDDTASEDATQTEDLKELQKKIPVGASRLHLVELPNLKMKPIYWSPLHDVSAVVRATWFYKNTMLPVETPVANQLEKGYAYLKPWTETWQDELNSCVENGPDAEIRIAHELWPKNDAESANAPEIANTQQDDDNLSLDKNQASGATAAHPDGTKPYLTSSAIYVDARNAQILRPSLLPSASRGRKPLSAIRKGRQIGIPVVRGFSRKLWDELHPSKANAVDVRNYIRRNPSQNPRPVPGEQICYACKMEELRPAPTDLVFVIHGIGQKLSERMESFHFTHAINAFRRQVNTELHSEPVWPHVRQGHGGIMVLPVNWRTTLSLDDPSLEPADMEDPFANDYSLADITPQTLPAVRSLISDVMLDIPYYLSHHKPKMIKAVVREANRIYRLWCKNNPGFQDEGRVHLLAHSLGSVMALDILSHQPTNVPRFNFLDTPLHSDIFEFDTANLFLCGSPVGFFLLLNKANLLPRKGREKPGSEGEDRLRGVAGEPGTYGCLAVDNLYNIMHTTDPIAYRVNAAVDNDLSNSLKIASIPSSTSSFWGSFGGVFRWNASTNFLPLAHPVRPATISKLPSTVEMETHDFTREEIAEKRMLLLNDNGQIDYYLSGGGGPLNIQYLNMLSAHSSYWTLTDFVRFFVVEIARKQGREGTLVGLRAEKKKGYKITKG